MNPTRATAVQPAEPTFTIGAWCSRPRSSWLTAAKKVGITDLHLMVHDDSTDRTEGAFEMDAGIRGYCQAIVDAGFSLHLTAWIQPYTSWLAKGCDELVKLCGDFGARSICWDAEEPWTQAKGGLKPEVAAGLINLYGVREGVSGIGYAPKSLDPLMARADYLAPQAYVTRAEGGLTHAGIPKVIAGWEKRASVGRQDHVAPAETMPALAAYDQGVGDSVQAWLAAGRPRHTLLWSLRHIASNPKPTGNLIARIRQEFTPS